MKLLDFYILHEWVNSFGIDTLADMEAYLTLTDQTITQLITQLKEEKNTRNLLDETLTMLTQFGKTPGDVFHVTDEHYSCSWGTFADEAQHIDYSAGYGTVNINPDLRVVGIDWWLERNECTGSEWSEWWEFKTMSVRRPVGRVALRRRVTDGSYTV